ncbi:unnamed protein product [Cyprideis torosa]|uniref:Uncharacterized protein n=1 Tax=Cyprideis torosa TaxID=163714 RepID=A0A7R8W7W3_9CRUS|nr:unnamed protein product [Cyprideis torosa]CAG0883117.1 unnamed protein product [Cyprideis torosa]
MLCIIRAMNVLEEQGSYWVSTTFFWNWLLPPGLALAEVLSQDVASRQREFSNKPPQLKKLTAYWIISLFLLSLWILTYPLWPAFIDHVLQANKQDVVIELTHILAPFYALFILGNLFNAMFYALGRTDVLALKALLSNLLLATCFILLTLNIIPASVFNVAWIFGGGLALNCVYFIMSSTGSSWLDARKEERRIRNMMVDYRKRAERRRQYYETIRQDPQQFLQLHGRPCKVYLEPAGASTAENPAFMMSWQGDPSVLIDRFDGRAHLDYIPDSVPLQAPTESPSGEERLANYERYRILVQNEFLGISESKFLRQIELEEKFGPAQDKEKEKEKKKLEEKKVAIPYTYDGSSRSQSKDNMDDEDDDEPEEEEEVDLDLSVDISKLTHAQCEEMNQVAENYDMLAGDYMQYLMADYDEQEAVRKAKQEEEEKQQLQGKKSRRERRLLREKKLEQSRIRLATLGMGKVPPGFGAGSGGVPIFPLAAASSKSVSSLLLLAKLIQQPL